METVILKIEGMSCGGCVKSVKDVLEKIPGVAAVEVALEKGEVAVSFDPATAGVAQFRSAVEDAGFDVAG